MQEDAVAAPSVPPSLLARWVTEGDRDWVSARLGGQLRPERLASGGVLLTGLDAGDLEALSTADLGLKHAGGDACLLMAPRSRLREWARASVEAPSRAIGEALLRGLDMPLPRELRLPEGILRFDEGPLVMAVVNVTPDSFSDGGRYADPRRAIEHALRLAEDGADLLDIGGESTRPGAAAVSEQQELDRVLPVIHALRDRVATPISIDTTKAVVAREALGAGAALVNDVSGFTFDPLMAQVTARAGAAACLQHIQGTPQTMQRSPRYGDVVAEVLEGLGSRLQAARSAGVAEASLVVDPGIGFGKTADHNLFLLRRMEDLRQLGQPILVGTSRKAFLGTLTGRPADERLAGTLGSVVMLASRGAVDLVRVHDVRETRDALRVAQAIRSARGGGDRFRS